MKKEKIKKPHKPMKNWIKFPMVLGLISASSALIIGGTFALTYKYIRQNADAEYLKGLKKIYPGAYFTNLNRDFPGDSYLKKTWTATIGDELEGYAYYADGKNQYGNIGLIIGIEPEESAPIRGFYVVDNNQTVGPDFDEWLKKNKFSGDPDDFEFKTGATYGSKLVRDLMKAAQDDYLVNYQGANVPGPYDEAFESIFPGDTFTELERDFPEDSYLKKIWAVQNGDALDGYAYLAEGGNRFGDIKLIAGFNCDASGTVKGIFLVENGQSHAGDVDDWVGQTDFTDPSAVDVQCGATYGAKLIQDMLLEAQADYLANYIEYLAGYEGGGL